MTEDFVLNVALLRRKVPNLTAAAKEVGLRPATVSNLCTGKIPIGRAEVRTLVSLAELAGCSLDELIIRGVQSKMVETGIKVIDVFAPVVRGGTIGLVAKPGMGQLVVLAELFLRLKQKAFITIIWGLDKEVNGFADVIQEADVICRSQDEVYEEILNAAESGEVILAADRSFVLSGELPLLRERLADSKVKSITIFLIDVSGEAVNENVPYGPLDTLWRFDPGLSERCYYPAIDPVASTSTLLENAQPENQHFAVQQKARKLLRRYRELAAWLSASGMENVPVEEEEVFQRGMRLEMFLTQPFYIATPITGLAGVWVKASDTIEHIAHILNGQSDNLEPKELFYIGDLLQ